MYFVVKRVKHSQVHKINIIIFYLHKNAPTSRDKVKVSNLRSDEEGP